MQEEPAPNIQNDFFNRVRKEKTRVAVFLNNGKRLTGRIRSFDKFTILLETGHGEQIIFKHAISTVGPHVSLGPREKERFVNRMNMDASKPPTVTPVAAVEKPQSQPARPGPKEGDSGQE